MFVPDDDYEEPTEEEWNEAIDSLKNKCVEQNCKNKNILSNCHIYQGSKDKDGYGKISFKGIDYRTHILSWESHNKTKRQNKKLCIRHLCNEKSCCNPVHLEIGTSRENSLDSLSTNKKVKLKVEEVIEIKKLLLENKSAECLSKKYKVAKISISRIKTGRTWSHIKI